jgi:hypothetical protein
MTRDEILKMEAGWEMDAKVGALIMGKKKLIEFDCFEPSTDISAAFEVLEKLGEVSWSLSPCWSLGTGKRVGFSFWIGGETTVAPTAPLAICRAALLAVMDKKG